MAKRWQYMLRVRLTDAQPWSEPEVFGSRRARDRAASFARIIGGMRTHSYEERTDQPKAEAEA